MTLSVIESSSGIWGLRVKISLMTVLQMCWTTEHFHFIS